MPLDAPKGIKWVQTAQDGVQFDPQNYDPSDTNAAFSVPAKSKAPFGSLAPGNRIDLLVQAPSKAGHVPGNFWWQTSVDGRGKAGSCGSSADKPMPFPETGGSFPRCLDSSRTSIPAPSRSRRELHFKSTADPTVAPRTMRRGTNPPFPPPRHTINGKQFDEGMIDQTMLLGATEEWTLYNDGGAAHPFHIHINPFQVVEIMDPE